MTTYAITAPEGFKSLRKGTTYYPLRVNPGLPTVLAYFVKEKKSTLLAFLAKGELVEGLAKNLIKTEPRKMGKAGFLPPWLSHLEDIDLGTADEVNLPKNDGDARSLRDYAVQRLAALQEALERTPQILGSPNPDRELNRLARECVPPQNETRFRNYFYTYLACGHNVFALLPRFEGGNYDRTDDKYADVKFGRPSTDGSDFGYPMTVKMRETCVKGFTDFVSLKTLTAIYRKTVIDLFGCLVRTADGKDEFYHPQGEPYPTYWQFRYQCAKDLTPEKMRAARMSDQERRNQHAPREGSYSQDRMCLMEDCRTDVNHTEDCPRSYLGNAPMDRLTQAKIVDATSGMTIGIGFTHGAESKWAYKAAQFCAAIPKPKFGEILGYPISEEEWPCVGLPPSIVSDRGPGASVDLAGLVPARGFTPSYTPQSNATVEAKHRKKRKAKGGAPTYVVSDLHPIQMARREVESVILQNRTGGIGDRMSTDMIIQGINTPLKMWNYLDAKLQNNAIPVPFAKAVRSFLMPVRFKIEKGALKYKDLAYDSPSYRATRLFRSSSARETVEVRGYVLEISVRKAWIEADGEIVEVDVLTPFHAGAQVDLTLGQLDELSNLKATNEYQRVKDKTAAEAASAQKFKAHTGKDWDGERTVAGRPPRGSRAGQREKSSLVRNHS